MTAYTATEYSKLWATANPELFTASVLDFLEQHQAESWNIVIGHRPGFVTFRANIKQ